MRTTRLVISVDLDRCEGHGRCYSAAPETFGPIDDFGRSGLLGSDLVDAGSDEGERVRRAADSCPERAIRLHEEGE